MCKREIQTLKKFEGGCIFDEPSIAHVSSEYPCNLLFQL